MARRGIAGRTQRTPGQIGIWGAWILRAIVVFSAAFTAFAGMQGTLDLATLRGELGAASIRWRWIYVHGAFSCAFGILSAALYGNWPAVAYPNALAVAWLVCGVLAVVFACAAFIPWSFWLFLRARTGSAWVYAAAVAVLAVASGSTKPVVMAIDGAVDLPAGRTPCCGRYFPI